jgi:site-specific DNA-cytosine methylase
MKKRKMLELFCGTKAMSNAFEKAGWEVFTVDWNPAFNPTLCADVGSLTADDIIKLCGGVPDVIHASPDCTTYSVQAISHHRRKEADGNLTAVTDYARTCDRINAHLIDLIRELKPKYYFIENPRAGMRKMDFMQGLPRYTVTYCQYGEKRMKPTDIWTNHPAPKFKPACKNGDTCHEAAPRGSQTGTQGSHNKVDKARIPKLLCEHIVDICEEGSDAMA